MPYSYEAILLEDIRLFLYEILYYMGWDMMPTLYRIEWAIENNTFEMMYATQYYQYLDELLRYSNILLGDVQTTLVEISRMLAILEFLQIHIVAIMVVSFAVVSLVMIGKLIYTQVVQVCF